MSPDVFRWITVFLCLFDVGCLAALYMRVGRLILPKLWMRCLMAANVFWLVAAASGSAARVGEPMTWRTTAFSAAAVLELAGFLGLYHWFGTARGRAYAAAVMNADLEWMRGRERRVVQIANHPARRKADRAAAG